MSARLPNVKGGRPSSYKPEYAEVAKKLAWFGATDRDLAEAFGVAISTVGQWKIQHPDFLAALKAGKDEADDRVERSLYARAVGYSYDAEKIFCSNGEVTRVPYVEHVPPSDTAMIFWLKNRRPDQWRDRREVNSGDGPLEVVITGGLPV
jgi:hypothetical protein